jgi:hypothetical protein
VSVETVAAEEKPEIEDLIKGLTGFDEIAIEQKFKDSILNLGPSMTMRAIKFVLLRREGLDDKTAYGEAMRLTLQAVKDVFRWDDEAGDDEGNG